MMPVALVIGYFIWMGWVSQKLEQSKESGTQRFSSGVWAGSGGFVSVKKV